MTSKKNTRNGMRNWLYTAFAILTIVLLINQLQIVSIQQAGMHAPAMQMTGEMSLDGVDTDGIQSTAQGIAAVMALEGKSQQQVMDAMVPQGTPSYGDAMGGISYDDPTGSLQKLAQAYRPLKAQIQQNNPEVYERWLSLAAAPKGITCEYCCGINAQAIRSDGQDMCGCQHHPALQTIALWLLQNTDMNDAEVLREVYKWKTLFFPQDMVALGTKVATGDDAVLNDLPGMVGGC